MNKFRFAPLSILAFFTLFAPLSIAAQSDAIRQGFELPDFQTALPWDRQRISGDTFPKPLPLLDACEVGGYSVDWYYWKNGVLYHHSQMPMRCWVGSAAFANSEDAAAWSKSWGSFGDGLFHAVVSGVKNDCGWVFTYHVSGSLVLSTKRRRHCD